MPSKSLTVAFNVLFGLTAIVVLLADAPIVSAAIVGAALLGNAVLIGLRRASDRGRRRAGQIAIAVLSAVGLALIGWLVIASLLDRWRFNSAAERFDGMIAQLVTALPRTPLPPPLSPHAPAAALRQLAIGKVLPIDRATRRLDRLYVELPHALRPEAPGEVKTVALLSWTGRNVGRYKDGVPAMVHDAHLLLVDHASGRALAQRRFNGNWPRQVRKSSESNWGAKPYPDIVRWLERCRQR